MLNIVGYLAKFSNKGIYYARGEWKGKVNLIAFADFSFADAMPMRQSSYRYVVYLNDHLIDWTSKTTLTVAASTAEAEYVALSECTKELLHIKNVLELVGIKVDKLLIVKSDSTGAICITTLD